MPDPVPLVDDLVPTSQGMVATFAGTTLGRVREVDSSFGAAVTTETTTAAATLTGTGANTRVMRRVEITMIDPGTVSFRCWGHPPFGRADIGLAGTLTFTLGGVETSGPAQLSNVQKIGAAGELVQGAYSFLFTGG